MWVRGIRAAAGGPPPWESPFLYTFGTTGADTRVDSTHAYYIWSTFSGITLVPLPDAPLEGVTIDLFMVAGGGAGQNVGVGAMGGGAAGEVKYVYGHPAPTTERMAIRGDGGGVLNLKGGDTTFDGLVATGGDRGGRYVTGVGGGNGVFSGGNPVGGTAGGGGAGGYANGSDAVSATVAGDGGLYVWNNWRTGTNEQYSRGGGGGGQGGGVTFGLGGETVGGGGRGRNGVSTPPINGARGILIIRHLRADL